MSQAHQEYPTPGAAWPWSGALGGYELTTSIHCYPLGCVTSLLPHCWPGLVPGNPFSVVLCFGFKGRWDKVNVEGC